MTDELKPFRCGCGGEAEVGEVHFWGRCYTVQCSECGIETKPHPTEADAITAWNRAMGTDARTLMKVLAFDATCAVCEKKKERTATPEWWDGYSEKGWYKCKCGKGVYQGQNYCSGCGARLEWK